MNKTFIFDLDGTLVLTERYHYEAFRAVFMPSDINYTYKLHTTLYTGSGDYEIIASEFKKKGIPTRFIQKAMESKQKLYRKIVKEKSIPIVKGANTFLTQALRIGIKMAIASSSVKRNVDLILEKTGLYKYFQIVVTREDVKKTKPHPEIFLYTAEKIEAQPNETVVFEDTPRGIEAAERGGFATVALLTTSTKKTLLSKGADMIIKNFVKLDISKVLKLKNKMFML